MPYYWRVAVYLTNKYHDSTIDGFLEKEKSFVPTDTEVDLRGKVFMVTGATGLIGKYLSLEFAKRGATVHMVCRDLDKCEGLRQEFVPESGNDDMHCHSLDLSLIENIHDFGTKFVARHPKLDVLVHAAGSFNPDRNLTSENMDPDFVVNVLSNFLLTRNLLSSLRESKQPRVIMVSSGCGMIYNLNWNTTEFENAKYYSAATFFSQKRQQIEIASVMANMTPSVHYSSVDPGWLDSMTLKGNFPLLYFLFQNRLRTVKEGADTALWLAVAEEGLYYESGSFYMDRIPVSKYLPRGMYRESPKTRQALERSLYSFSGKWEPDVVPNEVFDDF